MGEQEIPETLASSGLAAAATSWRHCYSLIAFAWFAVIVLLSWPIVFSFDLWVLKDRGNLLNLDYLVEKHLQPAIDTYYPYGLLPVSLQHLAFRIGGRSYWPMLAFDAAYFTMMAVFWGRFVQLTPQPRRWLVAVIALGPILIWVNPNLPYVLVQLSLLFSLLLVSQQRYSGALCVAVVGCYSVPSLPLVAVAIISLLSFLNWWQTPDRTVAALLRQFVPAAALCLLIGLLLTSEFGVAPVLSTILPISGARFYQTNHFGLFSRGSGLDFLYPEPLHPMYYISGHAGWWIISTLVLAGFAAMALYGTLRTRKITGGAAVILMCGALHAAFALFAFGSPTQHIIYDPLLALGTLAGLAWLPLGTWRAPLLGCLVGLGLLGNWAQIHETFDDWRQTRPAVSTLGLYANTAWTPEWTDVVSLAGKRRVLLLSYATGVHIYYPQINSADSVTVYVGFMLPADMERLLAKIQASEVLVEDLSGPHELFDTDPQIKLAMSSFCEASATANFKTYWNRSLAQCPPSQTLPP